MATAIATENIACIGEIAGLVWHYLEAEGSVTLSRLAREIDAPRDLVMQGVGWLAREGKVRFEGGPRGKRIALC